MGLFILIPLMAAEVFWKSFVALKLWGWFVVPAFGVPIPAQNIMIGLLCVHGIFAGGYKHIPEEKAAIALAFPFMYPALLLLLGWLAA